MRQVLSGLLAVSLAFAAGPAGTISSKDTFRLRGKTVPVEGVPSWPFMAGDELATDQGPATLQFRDGSRVVIGKSSKVKLAEAEGSLILKLIDGSMRYRMDPNSTIRLEVAGKPLAFEPGKEGTVSAGGSQPGSGAFADRVKTADLPPVSGRPRR